MNIGVIIPLAIFVVGIFVIGLTRIEINESQKRASSRTISWAAANSAVSSWP